MWKPVRRRSVSVDNIHRVGNLRHLGEKRRSAMFEFLGTGLFVTWLANGIKWYNRLANGI
jgi:hypothetical protein